MTLHRNIARLKTAVRYGRSYGVGALARLVKHKVLSRIERQGTPSKIDVLSFYSFVRQPVAAPISKPLGVAKNTVNWVIPPFGIGSGGHLNIFRFVRNLEELGYDCRIVIVGDPTPTSADFVAAQINKHFFPLKAQVYIGMENVPAAHISIATAWQTAYYVRAFPHTNYRCYFVQDFEPSFYAAGSESALAEESYRFGFVGLTAGGWLAEKLAREYGMTTHAIGFSYDRELYKPLPRRRPECRHVFFYARPPTQRRAFELGLLVLDEVVKRLPDVKVIFAGWDVSSYAIPFEHLNAGLVPVPELADLYSQCDAALVLSFSNLSLLPLELMACGTPVISNTGPWVEWMLNPENARLAPPTVDRLAAALVDVLQSPTERKRLREAGLRTVAATDWRKEAIRVAEVLKELG
ncbi:glycosyltransferase family 4 protein [Cupriavidus cauae]|uniref:glycosyltransferase family 4 protein n=1 Tax=Cupriavidus cauae TaxID=2608999 RepID=UPI00224339B2|nr:glycosyltransferase family 4 protein [Cupriavidus cauae]UZN50269.1 glycosyltransferase family 4 protein [Cupriavidus cauae]